MSSVLGFRHSNAALDWNPSQANGAWKTGKDIPEAFYFQRQLGDGENGARSGLPTPPGTKVMNGVTLGQQLSHHPASQSYQPSQLPLQNVSHNNTEPHQRYDSFSHMDYSRRMSGQITGHTSSRSQDWDASRSKAASDSIASYLQIPESVNKSKGSLAEFAAEITCLFWFETAATLQLAEDIPNTSFVDRELVPDAIPSIGFRKWVTTILSTTQVGKNVILLALMFIHRLKKFNPAVSGKRGSEFRLLTIALMLGNKFLDDNTYTNKTWAEVSGIAVTEIHIMEVEFLSNMRYDLYASESEWTQWKAKLGRFGAFYEAASKFGAEESKPSAPLTPLSQSFPHKVPSPSSTHHSAPLYPTTFSNTNVYTSLPNAVSAAPHLPRSPTRHYRNPVLEHLERKRSMDSTSDLPPAKRMYQQVSTSSPASTVYTPPTLVQTPASGSNYTPTSNSSLSGFSDEARTGSRVPRLPIPKIQTSSTPATMQPNSHLAPISFPAPRAMSTVYPSTSAAWSQPVTPISAGPPMGSNLYKNPIPNLGDGSREHSNYGSAHGSPSHGVMTPSRGGLSPSYFLTNRSSPYRPVRGVNTLLIPPPSASMQNAARNIPFDQMYYQPLSKTATERRTGPVPYYQADAWQNSNASTPLPQQYGFRA